MRRDLPLDLWAPLNYKRRFSETSTVWAAPTWTGDHARRLEAYKLLVAYLTNTARLYLDTDDEQARRDRCEYGDPSVLVDKIVDAVLGEEVAIAVDGAGEELAPVDGGQPRPADADADALQAWFDEWADGERPVLAFIEGETDSVGLGDGVYVISWDGAKGRPTIDVYDPGFYFPVLDDDPRSFPRTVHIAWEYEDAEKQKWVRRLTWRLVELDAERSLPWNEKPTTTTCLLTAARWPIADMGTRTWRDLEPDRATFDVNADDVEVRDLDLGIDFLPVVHMPNTVARKEHFGRSMLLNILQVLDSLQSTDTDLLLAARTTGFPPISVDAATGTNADGTTPELLSYGPGTVLRGKLEVVDTSRSLDALLKLVEHLLKRLATNSSTPGAWLGLTDPADVASGLLLRLSFGPLESMVRRMRLVREEKDPLILKFVARLAMQAGLIAANAKLPAIRLRRGPFLPTDRTAQIEEIRQLFAAKLVSRLTAVQMLMDLGLPIEDATTEVEAIEHRDFEGAKAMADALGDEAAAARYLGEAPPAAPPVILPPAPAGQ